MSRSKLSNTELKFYNTGGGSELIHAKIKGSSTDTLIFEGASSATKVQLTNVADPTGTGHVATFDYVNNKVNELSNGLQWKAPVKCKSTADVAGTLTGAVYTCTAQAQLSLDGILVALNDRVLLSEQTDGTQNGIYFCSTQGNSRAGSEAECVLTRATDADTVAELKSCAVFVEQGTLHADTGHVQTADSVILGTTALAFAQFSTVGEIVAGDALSKTGNTLNVQTDNSTIEIEAGNLIVKDLGITADKVATGGLTGAQIQDASLTDAELADDACTSRVILDGAVTSGKLSNGACTSAKVSTSPPAISSDHLQDDCVGSDAIGANQIQTQHCQDGFITSDKLGSAQILSSHLSTGACDSNAIGTAQVQTLHCVDAFCTTQKLASQAVTSSKISPANILSSHIASNQIQSSHIGPGAQIQASHMKVNSVEEDAIVDGAITSAKLGASCVTTSAIGQLNGLTVNGIINATSFVATSGAGEGDSGFSLPKCKTLSITFDDPQTIPGNSQFHTVGGDSALSAITFSADDDITICLASAVLRLKHDGDGTGPIELLFEVAFYNSSGVQQPYANEHTQKKTHAQLYNTTVSSAHSATLGDGATRIAGVRFRVKNMNANNTLQIIDSYQCNALAIDDTSGNTQRTFASGSIS